jgi:tRNA modification GTPase
VGAIGTVCLWGVGAGEVLGRVFKPAGGKGAKFEKGSVLVGEIVDGERVIDAVVIGCEGGEEFAINCHGNPIILEAVVKLLERNGAQAEIGGLKAHPTAKIESLKLKVKSDEEEKTAIAREVQEEQFRAGTLEGLRIILRQKASATKNGGLKAHPTSLEDWAEGALQRKDLGILKSEAGEILRRSAAAAYIIDGCCVVLAGPANSGKSTLMNLLCGRNVSIVADVPGTTRDWVRAQAKFGPVLAELTDTAGLDEALAGEVDREAQRRSIELLDKADIVLFVTEKAKSKEQKVNAQIKNQKDKMITVVNKSDLPGDKDGAGIAVSAITGSGVEELKNAVLKKLGLEEGYRGFGAVAFTDRQKNLLAGIAGTDSANTAGPLVYELLNGPKKV